MKFASWYVDVTLVSVAALLTSMNRIVRCVQFLLLFSFLTAQASAFDHELRHRGFVVDMAAVEHQPNIAALTEAMRHQLDIAADSGAKPEILTFFRNQRIALVPATGHGGGLYTPARGIELDGVVPPPDNPVVLHELIHAMHNRYVPQGNNNPDIEQFYQRAVANQLYMKGEYLLTNKGEFFAVTGSLYLWGAVAREPHDRETLRAKQPNYYASGSAPSSVCRNSLTPAAAGPDASPAAWKVANHGRDSNTHGHRGTLSAARCAPSQAHPRIVQDLSALRSA